MSKGPGAIQRAALEQLEAANALLDSIELAGRVFDCNPVTLSQAVSVRRALRALERAGRVTDMGRGFRNGRRWWALPKRAAEYQDRVRRVFGRGEGGQ